MSELAELYEQVILDHNRSPRNFRGLEKASAKAVGHNPLCGDQLMVFLHLDDDKILDISFLGSGCAISKASASLMTTALKGKSKAEAEELFYKFHQMVTGVGGVHQPPEGLGKLVAFEGVKVFPVRVKCATLSWHTMRAALAGRGEKVSTE